MRVSRCGLDQALVNLTTGANKLWNLKNES